MLWYMLVVQHKRLHSMYYTVCTYVVSVEGGITACSIWMARIGHSDSCSPRLYANRNSEGVHWQEGKGQIDCIPRADASWLFSMSNVVCDW